MTDNIRLMIFLITFRKRLETGEVKKLKNRMDNILYQAQNKKINKPKVSLFLQRL